MLKPGDVVWCKFPKQEGDGNLVHPGLVIGIEESVEGDLYARVAYGSSKKVSLDGCLIFELVISDEQDGYTFFAKTGLNRPTRFDMRVVTRLPIEMLEKIGVLDWNSFPDVRARLGKALTAAQ